MTLSELESALTNWDRIVPETSVDASSDASAANTTISKSSRPEDMKLRTRMLLDQLKEQIEELSREERPN